MKAESAEEINNNVALGKDIEDEIPRAEYTEKTYEPVVIEPKKGWRRYGGLIFGALASLFFSLTILSVKLLGHYHPFTISVWRFLGILIPSIPMVIYYEWRQDSGSIFRRIWPLVGKNRRENNVHFWSVQVSSDSQDSQLFICTVF